MFEFYLNIFGTLEISRRGEKGEVVITRKKECVERENQTQTKWYNVLYEIVKITTRTFLSLNSTVAQFN